MKKIHITLIFLPIFLFIITIASQSNASAQGFQLITSPLPIKLISAPGKTEHVNLRVKNQGVNAETIVVGLMKFTASSTQGSPNLENLTPKDTYSSWITFSPSQFVAQPNVWYTVSMTIKIPQTASLGYYLAATFSKESLNTKLDSTNLNGVVATPILLNVATPNEKKSMNLVSFSTNHEIYEYLPVKFNVSIHNTGNIYLSPVGNIFIDKGSKSVATLYLNDAGSSILPQSTRSLTTSWDKGFPVYKEQLFNGAPKLDSNGKFIQSLDWNFSKLSSFRFGKYTAKLLLVYNNGTNDIPIESTLSFWVIPWKLMIIALVILIIIVIGVWSVLKGTFKNTKSTVQKIHHK